jgi:hypothetical protein
MVPVALSAALRAFVAATVSTSAVATIGAVAGAGDEWPWWFRTGSALMVMLKVVTLTTLPFGIGSAMNRRWIALPPRSARWLGAIAGVLSSLGVLSSVAYGRPPTVVVVVAVAALAWALPYTVRQSPA